jgi:hypothetical protein
MVDTLTKAERSARMARVRGKDTTPELKVRKLIHRMGFRFRLRREPRVTFFVQNNLFQQKGPAQQAFLEIGIARSAGETI